MFGYRKTVAAALTAALALVAVAPAYPAVTVEGRAQGVPTTHVFKDLNVALAPLAQKLGIPVRHARGALEVQVDGTWLRVGPGDVTVTQNDEPMLRLSTFPVVRKGVLYVNAADIGALLDVSASVAGGRLDITRHNATSSGQGFEVKQLPTPTPRPSARPRRDDTNTQTQIAPAGTHVAGHAAFEMNDQANARYFQGMVDGGTPALHGTLYASGSPGSRTTVGGTVTLGPGMKHTSFGGIADPLYGQLFISGAANGIETENAAGTIFAWGGTPFDSRQVIAVSHRSGSFNRVFAVASQYGSTQALLGLQWTNTTSRAQFDRELWLGSRGAGAGLHYRTTGRFYTEERLGIATSSFPLVAGDAPRQANVGYDFSDSLGAKAGFASGLGFSARPFVLMYGRVKQFNFGVSHAAGQTSLSGGISTAHLQGDLDYGRSISGAFLNLTGRLDMPRGAFEANGYFMAGSRDAWLDYRLKREAPAFSIGLETVASTTTSRIGPVIGYTAPVGMALAVGVEMHPLLRGQGLRFSVHHTLFALDAHSQPHFVTVASDTRASTAIYVLVDGARKQQLTTASAKIAVPSGSHYISLQSSDDAFGSPEANVVDGNPGTLTLPLWPIVTVQGSLTLPQGAAARFVGSRPPLSGISVRVEPQHFTAETDANGNFEFPAQALAPGSTIEVDGSTLPDGLAAPAPQKISADGHIAIPLQSSKKLQKLIF